MRKNILLIILMAAIFAFVGTMNKSARAMDDPVSVLKGLKSSVRLHSWAGGDSLVHNLPSMVGTWWHSEYPVYCYYWLVVDERENGDGILSPCDKLKLSLLPGGDYVWVHVEDVSITLWVQGADLAKYVEFVKSFRDVGPAFVEEAIYPPVVCDTLREIALEAFRRYHLNGWYDGGDGHLSSCDFIDLLDLDTGEASSWEVTDVAIDILVQSIPDPTVPTLTQWGVIILVVLILGSAVFVMVRRRRAPVTA